MKDFFRRKENRVFLLIIAALAAFASWQESQIADLQERMMHVEASRYDDQLTNLYWKGSLTDETMDEYGKDIYHLQKKSTDQEWRLMQLEWAVYGK